MSRTLTPNADGSVTIPRELIDTASANGPITYEVSGRSVTLLLQSENERGPLWKGMTPEQRADEFLRWANEPRQSAPDLTDEQMSRESIYG